MANNEKESWLVWVVIVIVFVITFPLVSTCSGA